MDSKVFPCGSPGKESAHSMGDLGSIPGLGRSPGEWNGYPLQYFGLDNSMDHKTVSLGLALFTLRIMSCVFFFFVVVVVVSDGCMASLTQWTQVWASSGSWWWTGKPGVLQSMGLQRFGHAERLNWIELDSK